MFERREELEELMTEARNHRVPHDDQLELMENVRNGDVDAVYNLVDSCKEEILSIIEEYSFTDLLSVDEMFEIGSQALTTLAFWELGGKNSKKLFLYREWGVRQAILEKVNEKNKISWWKRLWWGKGGNKIDENNRLCSIIESWGI